MTLITPYTARRWSTLAALEIHADRIDRYGVYLDLDDVRADLHIRPPCRPCDRWGTMGDDAGDGANI